MEEIISKLKDGKVFKNQFFLLFRNSYIETEYDKIRYINPKLQLFSLCCLVFTMINFLSQYYRVHEIEDLTYQYETTCISILINAFLFLINYIFFVNKYNISNETYYIKYVSFLLNFLTHYYFIINVILFDSNLQFFVGLHILLKYGFILLIDSNFLSHFIVANLMIFIITFECLRRKIYDKEIIFMILFYLFYLGIVYFIDKREKKIQYSIITMRYENERLESLLTQANEIILDQERRSQQAESDLKETLETNNNLMDNIVGSVIASSVTSTIQKESASEAYFKFIS